jgi:hypothetical protein
MTSQLASALRAHADREFIRNVALKGSLFLITVTAIAVLVFLDGVKRHGLDGKAKPYAQPVLARHLESSNATELAEAAKHVPDGRFATTDDAFTSIYAETRTEKELLQEERNVLTRYRVRVQAIDEAISKLLEANPRDQTFDDSLARQLDDRKTQMKERDAEIAARPDQMEQIRALYEPKLQKIDAGIAKLLERDPSPTKFDVRLTSYLALRTALTNARTSELQEISQRRSAGREELKRAFDQTQPSKTANRFSRFGANTRVNTFMANVADPEHPLNILYEMLWYASVILAVVSFATLLLSPLFRAVPLQGAQESFADRLKQLLSFGSRAAAKSVAALGAVAVGTFVVAGATKALPSSPRYPPPATTQVVKQQTTAKLPRETVRHDETPNIAGPATDMTREIEALYVQVQLLQTAADEINVTLTTHEQRITEQYTALNNYAQVEHAHAEPDNSSIRQKLAELERDLGQTIGDMENLSSRVETTRHDLGQLAGSAADGFLLTRRASPV